MMSGVDGLELHRSGDGRNLAERDRNPFGRKTLETNTPIKTMTKLSLIVATFAVLATSAALADDQQLQSRLNVQRAQTEPREMTTVAVYTGQRGVGQREVARNEASETRFEWRHNGTGGYGAFVQGH